MDENTKTIAKGAIFVFFGIIISKLLTYIWRVLIARYIGSDAYGIFSLAFALIGIGGVFAILGFGDGLFRYTSFYLAKKKYNDAKGVMLFVFSINTVSILITSACLIFFSKSIALYFFHDAFLIWPVYIVAAILPFYVYSIHFLTLLTVKLRVDYHAFIKNIAEGIIKIFITLLFIYLGYTTLAPLLGYFVAMIGVFLMSAYFLFFRTDYGVIIKEKAKYHSNELIAYSVPLMFTGVVSIFISYTDTLMIGYFKGVVQTGIYNASLPTAQIISIASCFSVLFYPLFVENYSKKKSREMNKIFMTTSKWIFLFTLPMVFVLVFFPQAILNFLWGKEYISGAAALSILAIGYFISTIMITTVRGLMAIKKQNILLAITIVGTILNIILNYLLIPVFGIAGAAFATTISIFFIKGLCLFFIHKYLGFFPFSINHARAFFSTLFAFILTYIVVKFLFPITPVLVLIPSFGFYIIIYFLIMIKMKIIDSEDIKLLNALEKKSGINMSFFKKIIMRMRNN